MDTQTSYSEAQRCIEHATETSAQTLDLKHLRGLTRIPETIRGLPLKTVCLRSTGAPEQPMLDLDALAGLPDLEQLEIAHAALELASLGDLPRLHTLRLVLCHLPDPTGLAYLRRVETLELMGFDFAKHPFILRCLRLMPHLRDLTLTDCTVTDPAPLAFLTELTALALHELDVVDDHGISKPFDATTLAPLKGLRRLNSYDASFEDISPLAALTQLEELSLSDEGITDLHPLSGLTALRDLSLTSLPVEDLSHLAGLTNLQVLWAPFREPISDLAPLARMDALRTLALAVSEADLSQISGLPKLEELILFVKGYQDLSQLGRMTGLKKLKLDGEAVRDVSALQNLTKLEELRLARTNVPCLDVLQGLSQLKINPPGLY
jgi:internalin A